MNTSHCQDMPSDLKEALLPLSTCQILLIFQYSDQAACPSQSLLRPHFCGWPLHILSRFPLGKSSYCYLTALLDSRQRQSVLRTISGTWLGFSESFSWWMKAGLQKGCVLANGWWVLKWLGGEQGEDAMPSKSIKDGLGSRTCGKGPWWGLPSVKAN